MRLDNDTETFVLVIDDDAVVRAIVVRFLRDRGMRVAEAATAAAGLAAIATAPPDLVLLDVGLPGASGIEVLRELRSRGSEMPVILLTAAAHEIDRVAGFEVGADDYVTKPFSIRELHARVQAVLRRSRPHDERRTPSAAAPDDELDIRSLTTQERKILALLAEGKSNRQIAQALYLAEKTVRNYVSSLLAKLGMSCRTEAAVHAVRLAERGQLVISSAA